MSVVSSTGKGWSTCSVAQRVFILVVLLFDDSSGLGLSALNGIHKTLGSTTNLVASTTRLLSPSPAPTASASPTYQRKKLSRPPPPLIANLNLKRKLNQPKDYDKGANTSSKRSKVDEIECIQTMFMSPFHFPVPFSLNSTIYQRKDKTCKWGFVGTEPCIPMISCDTSQMGNCAQEYMELLDGYKGYMKFCSGDKVVNITAADDLRDIFVHFKVVSAPSEKSSPETNLIKCTVLCGKRGEGNPLTRTVTPKINPKCYCGTKPNDDKIVGGADAKKFEFPWLVALVETNTRQPFCGGSIINDKFILTAGHCIKGRFVDYRNVQIVINGHEFDSSPNQNVMRQPTVPKTYSANQLKQLDTGNGSVRYNIDEILVHPLYVSENNDFDIALLKVQAILDLSVRPTAALASPLQQPRAVCLPPLGSYLRTYSNKKAMIAGWGLPHIDAIGTPHVLQKLEVNIFSPAACKDLFAHRVNRRMICAGYEEGGKDSCSGDSGGPLVIEDSPNVWTQIGSVSWGEGCGEEGHPGVYFRTTEGVQWITYKSNYYEGEEEGDKGAAWCVMPK